MIITCKNCNKKFNVENSLIPVEGRQIQCGSCNYIWFYKNEIILPQILNKDIDKENSSKNIVKNIAQNNKITQDNKKIQNINIAGIDDNNVDIKSKKISNFLSNLIVFIISLIALIIVTDTFKPLLIKIFPNIEIVLFNIFETFKDIKLFIIDLT